MFWSLCPGPASRPPPGHLLSSPLLTQTSTVCGAVFLRPFPQHQYQQPWETWQSSLRFVPLLRLWLIYLNIKFVICIYCPHIFSTFVNYDVKWWNYFITLSIHISVAVGRKYPVSRLPWICLLWYLLQSLFHVQMGSNLNLGQSLYVQPLWLWVDDNLLVWSGAIHLYKRQYYWL